MAGTPPPDADLPPKEAARSEEAFPSVEATPPDGATLPDVDDAPLPTGFVDFNRLLGCGG